MSAPVAALLAKNLSSNLAMLKQHLADFSDADLLARPVPSANHANWQLGHLLFFEVMVCGMMGAPNAPTLPADFKERYSKESAKSDDPAKFLKKDELLSLLTQARGALVEWTKKLSPDDLAKPGPEQFKGWVDTVGDLILAIPGHATMHVGQFQVLRRKLGKPVIF